MRISLHNPSAFHVRPLTAPQADHADEKVIMGNAAAKADTVLKTPVVGAVNAVVSKDPYAIASVAQATLSKVPALAPLALAADVLMLAKGHDKAQSQADAASKDLQKLTSTRATPEQRLNSGLKLANDVRGVLLTGQQLAQAGTRVGHVVRNIAPLAHAANFVGRVVGRIMESPVGSVIRGVGKLLPFLNIAALGISVKAAHDLYRDSRSSERTKALAVGSAFADATILASTTIAALNPVTLPIALGGLLVQLALVKSRKHDKEHAPDSPPPPPPPSSRGRLGATRGVVEASRPDPARALRQP